MKKVVVAGSLNYDIFLALSSMPKLGETAKAISSSSSAGGKGANQAVQMAKLGLDVSMIGCVGTDQMAAAVLGNLDKAKVDCTWVRKTKEAGTGMGIVDVFPDGSVIAVISAGANGLITREDIRQTKCLIQKSDMLVLQLEIPIETVLSAIEAAAEHGKMVLLNAAPAAAIPEEYIRKCTYFVVNEVEAAFYAEKPVDSVEAAKKILSALSDRYQNCWICTLGKLGAVIAKEGQIIYIPAVQTEVRETTGAGDSFVGGFVYGILQGMDEETAGHFAALCSALTIRSVGAQNSMPTLEQVKKAYRISQKQNVDL